MRVEYEVGLDDLVEFNRHHALYSDYGRKTVKVFRIVLGVIATVGAVVIYRRHQDEMTGVAAALFIIIYSLVFVPAIWFYPKLISWYVSRMAKKLYSGERGERLAGRHTLSVGDERLEHQSPEGTSSMAWADIHKVDKSPTHVYIYTDPSRAVIVPRSKVSGDLEVFVRQVQAKMEEAGRGVG